MGEYDLTLGVQIIGIFFNTYLFGIVTFQFISYYDQGFKDPWWIRLLVAALLVIDVVHSAAVIYMAWGYFVANFDNPSIIEVALWPYTFTPVATALAALITQSFLSFRIYRLNRQRWLFIGFLFLSGCSFATGVASGIRAWLIVNMYELQALNVLVTWWLTIQMVNDTTIALVMAFTLWRSRTGYRKTDSVINRLIRGAIQTGVFSTIFAAGDLICFLTSPRTQFYGMFAIPLGRIYTNTLMHTLNMRGGLQDILAETVELTSPSFNKPRSIQIRVQDAVTTQVDPTSDFHPSAGRSSRTMNGTIDFKLSMPETHSTTSDPLFSPTKTVQSEN